MAEHTAEWYERQISQYKAELDAVNPKHEAAKARIVELESYVETLEKSRAYWERLASEESQLKLATSEKLSACQSDNEALRAKIEELLFTNAPTTATDEAAE